MMKNRHFSTVFASTVVWQVFAEWKLLCACSHTNSTWVCNINIRRQWESSTQEEFKEGKVRFQCYAVRGMQAKGCYAVRDRISWGCLHAWVHFLDWHLLYLGHYCIDIARSSYGTLSSRKTVQQHFSLKASLESLFFFSRKQAREHMLIDVKQMTSLI